MLCFFTKWVHFVKWGPRKWWSCFCSRVLSSVSCNEYSCEIWDSLLSSCNKGFQPISSGKISLDSRGLEVWILAFFLYNVVNLSHLEKNVTITFQGEKKVVFLRILVLLSLVRVWIHLVGRQVISLGLQYLPVLCEHTQTSLRYLYNFHCWAKKLGESSYSLVTNTAMPAFFLNDEPKLWMG